ncbi:MAG TPA: BTAD domain-containing putative transcriptional regulator [Thermoanaerobaculia bacterium]|nr:BTAD domain-containing putative transcriptional regulator [Thermoanaerobaculia bacterium]
MPPSLPVALTPLLGRQRELDETARLLGATRLLTITGAGGSGKTRLALELAHRMKGRYEIVVWVDLAPLIDGELIAQQILSTLDLREAPTFDVEAIVLDRLRDRTILLALDNCEHLIDPVASIVEVTLRGCPNTTILATSREAIIIVGEQTWLVPPLAEDDAIQLFAERARSATPAFAVTEQNRVAIAEICRRLDNVPLAIELAAARVRVLSLEQIIERLDDAFELLSSGSRTLPRHRTIRETIDWSFRLLTDDEQTLFRRLAVFTDTFTLEAAESVCGDVLHLLSNLVDKSLVQTTDDMRCRFLETVRQFAAEKLEQSDEREALREKHARYFLELVERAEPLLFAGAGDAPTIARVDHEIGNVRAAFDWAEEDASRSDVELRLVYAIHWYWFARGHFHEARRRIKAALPRANNADAIVRALAFVAAGDAAVWQADWASLRPMIDEAVAALRTSNDRRALAQALTILGAAIAFAGEDASEVFAEAEALARSNARDVALALTLYWSGIAAQLRSDWSAARTAFDEAHQIGVERDHKPAIAHPLTLLGHIALREGKLDEAIRDLRRALDVHAQTDDRWGLTQTIEGIGIALLDSGETEVGTKLLAATAAAWLELGARPSRDEILELEKDERIREALGDERLRIVLASGASLPYDMMLTLARDQIERLATRATPTQSMATRVRALGPLEIEPDRESQSGRARELLLFLLCNPSGATKEQIGAALWPDVDTARLRNNFHVTIHRLRKLLGGADWVIVRGETYALKPGIEFDVAAFERAIKAGDFAHAVDLYRGDFFANATTGEWHEDLRARLRDTYANALTELGRAHMTSGNFAAAAEVYEKLVALDDLDEQAVRNLMTCHGKIGNPSAAARAYRRLVDALKKELDVDPDPATTRVHARVIGAQ